MNASMDDIATLTARAAVRRALTNHTPRVDLVDWADNAIRAPLTHVFAPFRVTLDDAIRLARPKTDAIASKILADLGTLEPLNDLARRIATCPTLQGIYADLRVDTIPMIRAALQAHDDEAAAAAESAAAAAAAQTAEAAGDETNTPEDDGPTIPKLNGLNLAVAGTLDRGVQSATGKSFPSLKAMYDTIVDMQRYITVLRSRPTSAPADIEVKSTGVTPAGRCRMVNAFEPFRSFLDEGHRPMFDFEVPAYDWDGPHPLVPTARSSYTYDPEALSDCLRTISIERNTYIHGPPGCGKTTLTEQIAARLGRPHCLVSFDGSMRKREILGGFVINAGDKGSSTAWQDGLLIAAITGPSIIDLDEVDRCDPDLAYVLHQLYERKGISLLEDSGRRIQPHPHAVLIATANTLGRDDGETNFQLRHDMSEATRDRFGTYIEMDYLKEDREVSQLLSDVPRLQKPTAENLVKLANLIRTAMKGQTIGTTCSPRTLTTTALMAQTASTDPAVQRHREMRAVQKCMIGRMALPAERSAVRALAIQIYGEGWPH